MTYISFLDKPNGLELGRMNVVTNSLLTLEPEILTGGSGRCLLFRKDDLKVSNVALDSSLTLTTAGLLSVTPTPSVPAGFGSVSFHKTLTGNPDDDTAYPTDYEWLRRNGLL